jgi:hypothetical protein
MRISHIVLTLIGFIIFVSGCAATHTAQIVSFDIPSDFVPYVPVSVSVHKEQPLLRFEVKYLDHIYRDVGKSGLFALVSPANSASRYRLDIFLERGSTDNLAKDGLKILSAATLFIVPVAVNNTYKIVVSVFDGEKLIKSYSYEDSIDNNTSIISDPNPQKNEFDAISNLLNHFYRDFLKDDLLPRAMIERQGTSNERKG